jgi:hypothetical protein
MKYELTEQSKLVEGRRVYRIRALKDFSDVKSGTIGGFVETDRNLSHEGNCWIYDNAVAMDNSIVVNNAKLKDNSMAMENSQVLDDAVMCNSSVITENAQLYGKAKMYGESRAYGKAEIFGNAKMMDMTRAFRDAWVYQDVIVTSVSSVTEKTTKTPISLSGLNYNVTIMDNHISIDCETRTIDEWEVMSDEELLIMNGIKAVRFARRHRDLIIALARQHQKNQSNT